VHLIGFEERPSQQHSDGMDLRPTLLEDENTFEDSSNEVSLWACKITTFARGLFAWRVKCRLVGN
jgi:hypothetical protein